MLCRIASRCAACWWERCPSSAWLWKRLSSRNRVTDSDYRCCKIVFPCRWTHKSDSCWEDAQATKEYSLSEGRLWKGKTSIVSLIWLVTRICRFGVLLAASKVRRIQFTSLSATASRWIPALKSWKRLHYTVYLNQFARQIFGHDACFEIGKLLAASILCWTVTWRILNNWVIYER